MHPFLQDMKCGYQSTDIGMEVERDQMCANGREASVEMMECCDDQDTTHNIADSCTPMDISYEQPWPMGSVPQQMAYFSHYQLSFPLTVGMGYFGAHNNLNTRWYSGAHSVQATPTPMEVDEYDSTDIHPVIQGDRFLPMPKNNGFVESQTNAMQSVNVAACTAATKIPTFLAIVTPSEEGQEITQKTPIPHTNVSRDQTLLGNQIIGLFEEVKSTELHNIAKPNNESQMDVSNPIQTEQRQKITHETPVPSILQRTELSANKMEGLFEDVQLKEGWYISIPVPKHKTSTVNPIQTEQRQEITQKTPFTGASVSQGLNMSANKIDGSYKKIKSTEDWNISIPVPKYRTPILNQIQAEQRQEIQPACNLNASQEKKTRQRGTSFLYERKPIQPNPASGFEKCTKQHEITYTVSTRAAQYKQAPQIFKKELH